jgi:hypothetical protein
VGQTRLPNHRLRSAVCALLALAACACSKSEPGSKTGRDAAAQATLPPIPTQPLRLLPAGVRAIVSANLEQVRASPHYATAERWIHRYACLDAASSQWLLARTDRVVLAAFGERADGQVPKSLAVLRGHYQQGDLERALAQTSALLEAPSAPATDSGTAPALSDTSRGGASSQQRGRFRLLTSGSVSAAQLGDGLIALGDTDRVLAALDVADGKQPPWSAQDALMPGLDADRWLSDHSAALITRVNDSTAQRIGRELSAIGGRRLGENLNQTSAALAVVLGRDLRAQAQVLYAQAATATEAAEGLRSVLARADLVLRLTGLPSALDRTRISADGARLDVSLVLSAEDLDRLSTRLQPLLESGTPSCGAQADRSTGDAGRERAAR